MYQIGEIERNLTLFLEIRDYILRTGDRNPDKLKQFLEAEKSLDKDRKQIRYEKKRKIEMETLKEKNMKIERRMERTHQ